MQNNASYRTLNLGADLEQAQTQGTDLRVGAGRTPCLEPYLLHQDISRRRHQHTQLVGMEITATGPVDRQPVLEFLDAFSTVSNGMDSSSP